MTIGLLELEVVTQLPMTISYLNTDPLQVSLDTVSFPYLVVSP